MKNYLFYYDLKIQRKISSKTCSVWWRRFQAGSTWTFYSNWTNPTAFQYIPVWLIWQMNVGNALLFTCLLTQSVFWFIFWHKREQRVLIFCINWAIYSINLNFAKRNRFNSLKQKFEYRNLNNSIRSVCILSKKPCHRKPNREKSTMKSRTIRIVPIRVKRAMMHTMIMRYGVHLSNYTVIFNRNWLNINKLANHILCVQVIQVDFEGRNPMTSDFHGIRQLLHQLFLKSDINLSELTDIVTGMNRVYRFVHHAIAHHCCALLSKVRLNNSLLIDVFAC